MLVCFWSPKGGSGTSVVAAAAAAVLGREGPARLADLAGDQPAIFGLAHDPDPGLRDWLRIGPEAPTDALDRFAVAAGSGLALLGAGSGVVATTPPESGAALAVALRADPRPTIADVGRLGPAPDALHGLVEVADAHVIVVRGCYLALRRAMRVELTSSAAGVVFVDELRASTARAVDAGVLATRLPDSLARAARDVLRHVGWIRKEAA